MREYSRVARCAGWRLGWRVSLACASSHFFCRYDDGEVTHNIEATTLGRGGFRSHPDEYYRELYHVPQIAVECGSDLCSVTPCKMLGLFISIRALHFGTIRQMREAELGLLLARHLFPQNRILYNSQMEVSLQRGLRMFERGENGHPENVGRKLREWLREGDCLTEHSIDTNEVSNANNHHAMRSQVFTTER